MVDSPQPTHETATRERSRAKSSDVEQTAPALDLVQDD
jgi:hypothetical protein